MEKPWSYVSHVPDGRTYSVDALTTHWGGMWAYAYPPHRSKIHFLTFEIYRSENDFYCGHSYIARYDERIRFNGKPTIDVQQTEI